MSTHPRNRTQRHAWLSVAALALASVYVALTLAGCATTLKPVEKLEQLRPNDIMLVGRVELVPPLKPGEQNILLPGPYNDENLGFFFVNSKFVEIPEAVEKTPYEAALPAYFGETFYVQSARKPVHLTVMFVYMTLTRQKIERVWLPGGLVVEPQAGDRAVYMGTIRYHRNEFFDLKKVELVDEFTKEQSAFSKKFGSSLKLVKRLAKPEKGSGKK